MTITEGTVFEVNASGTYQTIVNLTSTTAICFYQTLADEVSGEHLTLSGNTITGGAELVIDSTASATFGHLIKAMRMTDTSVLLVYSYNSSVHRARVISVSGTTLTAHTLINLTDTANIRSNSIARISATAGMYVYGESGGTGKARILTVSGTTVTENAAFTFDANCFNVTVSVLSSSKSVVAFIDASNSDRPTGEVLDVSGTTITGNADVQLSTTAGDTAIYHRVSIATLDSTHVIVGWWSGTTNCHAIVVTESGASLTPGVIENSSGRENGAMIALSATRAIFISGRNVIEYSISGTTITEEDAITISDFETVSEGWITNLTVTNMIATGDDVAGPPASAAIPIFVQALDVLGLAGMFKPASIDAAGTFIYVALLEDGFPILTKISTALNADGTTVFNPGAGDNIGVECGRFSSDTVWVAGNFDGTNVVEKSEDAGSTFTVKDDATIGNVRTFVMGPDSDERLLIFDETNGDIIETIDDGTIWTTINAAVTPEVNAIARLGENVQESVFGNDGGVTNSINYSVNSGDDLEDFMTGVYPNENATRVIAN